MTVINQGLNSLLLVTQGYGSSAEIPVVDTACISIRANAPAVSIAPGEPVIRLQAGGKQVTLRGRCRGNDD